MNSSAVELEKPRRGRCASCLKPKNLVGVFPETGVMFCEGCWPEMKQKRRLLDDRAKTWDVILWRRLSHL